MADGEEPIDGEEIIYRRIPVSQHWYELDKDVKPSPQAFYPTSQDLDGISLARAKYSTPSSTGAKGRKGRKYWIATLRAADIFAAGIEILPDPPPDGTDPSHARIASMHYADRKSPSVRSNMVILSELCITVEGPFDGTFDPDAPTII
jgi:hypothetical protein